MVITIGGGHGHLLYFYGCQPWSRPRGSCDHVPGDTCLGQRFHGRPVPLCPACNFYLCTLINEEPEIRGALAHALTN